MATPKSLTEASLKLESLMPRAMTTLFKFSENDPLRHYPVGQIRLLRHLLGGKKTATELCVTLRLSPSSLTQISARLISAGLVEKENSPQDKRVRMLALTSQGFDMMNQRRLTRARSAMRMLEDLGEERVFNLISILERVVDLDSLSAISAEAVV